jgi:hypothetical protein
MKKQSMNFLIHPPPTGYAMKNTKNDVISPADQLLAGILEPLLKKRPKSPWLVCINCLRMARSGI